MKALLFGLLMTLSAGFTANATNALKIVPNEKVCMVTDMYFPKKQIPVAVENKTYFGCCANCKATLETDAKARTATDPVSGKPVDKATAVIAAKDDNSVVYFESMKTFKTFSAQPQKPTQ